MEQQPHNPSTDPAPRAGGVRSDEEAADSPMNPATEIDQLDRSLSQMTSLLLSDGDDDLELEGDFAEFAGEADEPPLPQASDPSEELEQVQAAVAAALDEVAEDLDPSPASPGDEAVVAADRDEPEPTEEAHAEPEVAADLAQPERAQPEPAPPDPDAIPTSISDDTDPNAVLSAEREAEQALGGAAEDLGPSETDKPHAGDRPKDEDHPDAIVELGERSAESDGIVDRAQPEAVGATIDSAAEPAETATPARPEPAATTEAAPAQSPAPEAPAAESAEDAVPANTGAATPKAARASLAALAPSLFTVIAAGLEPVAERVEQLPRVTRQSLAWLALWTAFNAGGVWAYLVFFRTTTVEPNPAAATQIVGSPAAAAATLPPGVPGTLSERP